MRSLIVTFLSRNRSSVDVFVSALVDMEYSEEEIVVSGPPEPEIPEYPSFAHFLLPCLREGGKRIAQISNATGEKTTYDQILENSARMAVALQNLGVGRGDVIGICSENRFELTISAIATISIGAICSPMNILYGKSELVHAMKISKPKFVFCSPFTIRNVLNVAKDIPSLIKVICYGKELVNSSVLLYEDLLSGVIDTSGFKLIQMDVYKDPIVVFFSSGTTGLAKAVVLTHYNFIYICHQGRGVVTQLSPDTDCVLTIIPWFHSFGFVTHLTSLAYNIRYVFIVKFEEVPYLKAIQDYKITIAVVAPPLMVFLAKHPLVDKYDTSSLKEIRCGAAPLSKEIQMAVQQRIGVKTIRQGYGLTETTLGVCQNSDYVKKPSSCGLLLPGIKAKVVDLETGKSLGPNKEGELCFKGPNIMLGYLGDKTSTDSIFDSNGWLHTGDVGYYDEDNYFYIVDRLKELIKYKGFQVPPAEIEAVLLQNPVVKDVGVVGLPDEVSGELPVAFVVLQPGVKAGEKDLIDFVAERLSPQKRLRGGVRFIREIPKNPSGKILRRELRDLLKKTPASKL